MDITSPQSVRSPGVILFPKAFSGERYKETEMKTADTQTIPNPIVFVNQQKKKKPFDVKFSNIQEPRINPNIKYSAKQAYRQYKSKIEPVLKSKIQIEEEDDMVKKIKEAFGIKRANTNFSDVITASTADIFTGFQDPRTKIPEYDNQNNVSGRQITPKIADMTEYSLVGYVSSKLDYNRSIYTDAKVNEIENDESLTEEEKQVETNKIYRQVVAEHSQEVARLRRMQVPDEIQFNRMKDKAQSTFRDDEFIDFNKKVRNLMENEVPERTAVVAVAEEILKRKQANNDLYLNNISLQEANRYYEGFSRQIQDRVEAQLTLQSTNSDWIRAVMNMIEELQNQARDLSSITVAEGEDLTGRKRPDDNEDLMSVVSTRPDTTSSGAIDVSNERYKLKYPVGKPPTDPAKVAKQILDLIVDKLEANEALDKLVKSGKP